MRADVGEWFNVDAFVMAARKYCERHDVSFQGLSAQSDIAISTLMAQMGGVGELTLRVACAVAEVCDLSLDTYRLTQSQHDEQVDGRIQQRAERKPDMRIKQPGSRGAGRDDHRH